jgi:hypothetical protein
MMGLPVDEVRAEAAREGRVLISTDRVVDLSAGPSPSVHC